MIHHDKNYSNGPNYDATVYPSAYPTRKSIKIVARNNNIALIQLLFSIFYEEWLHEVKEIMEKKNLSNLGCSVCNKCKITIKITITIMITITITITITMTITTKTTTV